MRPATRPLCASLLLTFALLVPYRVAHACGCFAPPDPVTSILQSGERIVFAADGTNVTAIIQIQYSGAAADFGWLLPLPSLPTLDVSSDEVFASLVANTTPAYSTMFDQGAYDCFDKAGAGGGAPDLGFAVADLGPASPPDPLVVEDSVGPYDYAVLKADDKTAMLAWLAANHYFVPAGTDTAVSPYIHAGAYFLALRLKTDKSAGDLQPVVVRYPSALPMIPITLTSVTATDKMGIWVWVLGSARAIPRNYYHAVIDDAALQWPALPYGFGPSPSNDQTPPNYIDVVSAAVKLAPQHHAFVTEHAAMTGPIVDTMFPPTRFGDLTALAAITDAGTYLDYLKTNGYSFTPQLVAILQNYIKQPANLLPRGGVGQPPSPANYYYNFDYWFQTDPQSFAGFDLTFDPVMLTNDIQTKIVQPVRDAATLFKASPWMTRLHTRLDAADMNSDPVFSFNPDLPAVDLTHEATGTGGNCQSGNLGTIVVHTPQGFCLQAQGFSSVVSAINAPPALRIEMVRESGQPIVTTDYTAQAQAAASCDIGDMGVPLIADGGVSGSADMASSSVDMALSSTQATLNGCSANPGAGRSSSNLLLAGLALMALVLSTRRRR